MTKKGLSILFACIALLLIGASTCSANDKPYSYYKNVKLIIGEKEAMVNNQPILMDQPAYSKDGRTLVPFRFLGESLGAAISWDARTNQAKLKLGESEVIVVLGSKAAYVDNDLTSLDVPAELNNGRLFVPLRFISEALGANVNFDSENNSIAIQCVNTADWEWYTAPGSGLMYKHPKDWSITLEEDETMVVFTSPNGSTLYAYWYEAPLEDSYSELKKAAIEAGWKFENEFLNVPNSVHEGFELQYSKFDPENGAYVWYVCYGDIFNNNNSLIGEVNVNDAYFEMDAYIMGTILFS